MKLMKLIRIKVRPAPPFDFDSTFHKPDHFTSGDNEWVSGTRWQTWIWKGKSLRLKFVNRGTKEKPNLEIEIYSAGKLTPEFIDTLTEEVKYRFNLNLDLTPFYNKFGKDKILKLIIDKWKGMRPGHPSSLYEYLIIGVVLQNATVRRSMQMFQALLQNYGTLFEYDGKKLWCFWEPGRLKTVTEEELRALKVGYRAKYIKKIDDQFANGQINEFELRKKDLQTQRSELQKLYGVGPATVWYLLFDVFHHWDFFNHISPWEQKIYSKVFFDRDPEKPVSVDKLLKHFKNYQPFQHLAVHYIWEDLWWKRKEGQIVWLDKLVRI